MLVNGVFFQKQSIPLPGPLLVLIPMSWITASSDAASISQHGHSSHGLMLSNLWDQWMLSGGRGAIDPPPLTVCFIHHSSDHSSTRWHFHLDTHTHLSPFTLSHIHPSLHPSCHHPSISPQPTVLPSPPCAPPSHPPLLHSLLIVDVSPKTSSALPLPPSGRWSWPACCCCCCHTLSKTPTSTHAHTERKVAWRWFLTLKTFTRGGKKNLSSRLQTPLVWSYFCLWTRLKNESNLF